MAHKSNKQTRQEKIERERALQERLERSQRLKRRLMLLFTIILCAVLILAFCFPALTTLLSA